MSKPVIFFSHSSKDKDMIVSIKEKMVEATVGSVEIFLSSDGQSIPFGTNWLHKIEDGLKNAQLMFVFVTENSLSSGWIYYEAGFAYSKGIRVIPVAIGVDIASSGAPLSLLQGYNLVSEDSLNNFIHIINSEFALSINESAFVERDFQDVMNCASLSSRKILFKELVSCIDFSITTDHNTDPCISNECIDKFFNDIINFLDVSDIPYSRNKDSGSYHKDCIVANGIRIEYDNADKTSKYDRNQGRLASIFFRYQYTILKRRLHYLWIYYIFTKQIVIIIFGSICLATMNLCILPKMVHLYYLIFPNLKLIKTVY